MGETLRAHVFPETSRKRKLYSGFFVLLKLKLALPYPDFRKIHALALHSFHSLVPLSKLSSKLHSFMLDID